MASNRKTVRQAFADLLETALASLAQKVYDYRVGDFGNQSPVVVASNAGSRRERISFQGSKVTTYLQVDVFVLYSDEGSWGEDDAEERLDDIEAAIAGVLDGNQQNGELVCGEPGGAVGAHRRAARRGRIHPGGDHDGGGESGMSELAISVPAGGPPTWGLTRSLLGLQGPGDGGFIFTVAEGLAVEQARNLLVERFLASPARWLLFVDRDALLHPLTAIRLLSWNEPIVAALSFARTEPTIADDLCRRASRGCGERQGPGGLSGELGGDEELAAGTPGTPDQ